MPVMMLRKFNISQFQNDLLAWYSENKRELPWRKDQDPYNVWVSEIMLQQTQVNTVIPYFLRFMELFPNVHALAEAKEEDVLKAWEGLGYYSRARNLHKAAREVVHQHHGKIPDDPKQLGELKGIGPYTKGAILSIAFNQAEPAVDGNVMRVFSRVLKIEDDTSQSRTRRKFKEVTRELISKEDPSSFNQAIMDLGATICTPKSPMCLHCPINAYCQAFNEGIQDQLPVKAKKSKQKEKAYYALLIKNEQGQIVIEQRPETGLLANLWQFPMIPKDVKNIEEAEQWLHRAYGLDVTIQKKHGQLKHIFTHLIWKLDVYEAVLHHHQMTGSRMRLVSKNEMKKYPFPVSHQKMMKYL